MTNNGPQGTDYSKLVALVQKPSQASGGSFAQNSSDQQTQVSAAQVQQQVAQQTAVTAVSNERKDLTELYEVNQQLKSEDQLQQESEEFWDKIDALQADLEAKGLSPEEVKIAVDYFANLFNQGRILITK